MKTGHDALGNAENESGSGKQENRTTPSVTPKTCLGAQNKKTTPDDLGIAENESESAKHENGTPTPSAPPKRSPGGQNMKMGLTPSVPLKTSPGGQNMKMGHDASEPP
jgi:hypothetical protein